MKLALFDLDKTLIPQDSDHGWGDFLARRGYVDAAYYQERNHYFYSEYARGTLDIFEYSAFVFQVLAAHDLETLEAWHHQFMAEVILPMVTPAALDLVAHHRKAGDECVLISATNEFVITPIAQVFGFAPSHIIGTRPEQMAGRFTGRVAGVPSFQAGKITRLQEWLTQAGRSWSDYSVSYFYSDSLNDLPLLERVSHPVACNPDATLRQIAMTRQWQILDLFSQPMVG